MTETKKKKFKPVDLAYIGVGAALIAVCSWISIPLTVPITLQTMGVCIVAGLLGFKRGSLSVLTYILVGAVGVPVFSGFKGGIGALAGPTGGYIIGFILTAVILGLAADKLGKKLWVNIVFMVLGIAVCYLFGTLWFSHLKGVTVIDALSICVFPFLIPDAVKIAIASVLVNRLKNIIK